MESSIMAIDVCLVMRVSGFKSQTSWVIFKEKKKPDIVQRIIKVEKDI